jgi:UDP-3-O-[3-hydroxymyristoyl] glucosamine N-acyltransferase
MPTIDQSAALAASVLKGKKYGRAYFLHPLALAETASIGVGTRVWAYAHIMSGAEVGSHCNLSEHVFVEFGVRIGDGVSVKSGV